MQSAITKRYHRSNMLEDASFEFLTVDPRLWFREWLKYHKHQISAWLRARSPLAPPSTNWGSISFHLRLGTRLGQANHEIAENILRQAPKAVLLPAWTVASSLWSPYELLAMWLPEWFTSVFPSTSSSLHLGLLLPSRGFLDSSDLLSEWQMFPRVPFSSLQISAWPGQKTLTFLLLK